MFQSFLLACYVLGSMFTATLLTAMAFIGATHAPNPDAKTWVAIIAISHVLLVVGLITRAMKQATEDD